MHPKAVHLLQLTHDTIQEPECWTTRTNARDINQQDIDVSNPKATCWCLHGAFSRAVAKLNVPEKAVLDARDTIADSILISTEIPITRSPWNFKTGSVYYNTYHVMTEFNDHPTTNHLDVINILKHAIKFANL